MMTGVTFYTSVFPLTLQNGIKAYHVRRQCNANSWSLFHALQFVSSWQLSSFFCGDQLKGCWCFF